MHIREGFPYVIAQQEPKGSHPVYEQVLESSFDPIQCALDYVSATGAADLQTLDAAYKHLVWWPEEDGLVLKVCETEVLRPAIYAEGTVLDSQGRPKPHPPAPAPRWDQSMRFYRRAQLSDDVFDATRSLWLATENLLDEIAPWKPGEPEGTWVKRAFKEAMAQGVHLVTAMPPSTKAAHNAAHDYFYDELRKDLFHAKRSRDPALPHDAEDIERIAARHRHLSELYTALLQAVVATPRAPSGGGLTAAGFRAMSSAMEGLVLQVGRAQGAPSARLHVVSISSDERRRVLLAEMDGDDLERVAEVEALPILKDGQEVGDLDLKAPLKPTGLARLQGQFVLTYVNAHEPRAFVLP